MRGTTAVAILILPSCFVSAHGQTWSIGDKPFPTLLSRLPKAEQGAILKGLQPGFERLNPDEAELAAAKKELRVLKAVAIARPLTLIQAYGGICAGR